MPFLVHRNQDGTFRISNAETGKVYAYATTKPTQVMSIVERYHNATVRRKSGRRSSTMRRGSARRGNRMSVYSCPPGDIQCELEKLDLMMRYR